VAVTNRRFHAKEYVRETSDLSQFDGIVVVGGDGLLYEVINVGSHDLF
jgi:diacylglycerol kinase family enzyme